MHQTVNDTNDDQLSCKSEFSQIHLEKLPSHPPSARWLRIKADGRVFEMNPPYLASPPSRMASSICFLTLKCFLTGLIPSSCCFHFFTRRRFSEQPLICRDPFRSRRGEDAFFPSPIFETANSSPEKYLFSFVCLFVCSSAGPREALCIGRDVTRRRCIPMSATLN